MSVYACELCGYEYRPKAGDPDNGIDEGTDFEDLPADWGEEEKIEYIADGKRRLEKSKWMLTVLLPLIVIYGYEIVELFIIPMIEGLFR